ncbi:MAG: hypothetical protein M3389_12755 [Actinomycetota bacterium]|nr:hypothetical protein [Actinomycetota bacterium]
MTSPPNPFVDPDGEPRLAPCALLFVDLLGVSAMAEADEAQRNLTELARVLRGTYRDFLRPDSPWPAAMFSDTLVVASPLGGDDLGAAETATGGLIIQAAWLQLNLAMEGYSLRGGLTVGLAHLHDGLVFGPALVEAYQLEQRRAIHPRIVLGQAAADVQRDALRFYAEPADSPQNLLLAVDQDGNLFIDYLALLVDEPDDLPPGVADHAGVVAAKVDQHRGDSRRWDNYRWVAEYHNAFCARHLPDEPGLVVDVEASDRRFGRLV